MVRVPPKLNICYKPKQLSPILCISVSVPELLRSFDASSAAAVGAAAAAAEAAPASPPTIVLVFLEKPDEPLLDLLKYRVFIKYRGFFLKKFLNSASSAAAIVFYLPGVCVHTLTPRENRERPESGIF